MALCLLAPEQPRIYSSPAELWIDTSASLADWGIRLAWDAGALALYVCPERGRRFVGMGIYHVAGSTIEPLELARRTACPGIATLSRIIFLSGPHCDTSLAEQCTAGDRPEDA